MHFKVHSFAKEEMQGFVVMGVVLRVSVICWDNKDN